MTKKSLIISQINMTKSYCANHTRVVVFIASVVFCEYNTMVAAFIDFTVLSR